MSDQQKISEYINNLKFKKSLGRGFNPDEVYEAIRKLSSMYDEVLSEAYMEMDELKAELELVKGNDNSGEIPASDGNACDTEASVDKQEAEGIVEGVGTAEVSEKEEATSPDENAEAEASDENKENEASDEKDTSLFTFVEDENESEDAYVEDEKIAEELNKENVRIFDKSLQRLKRSELLEILSEQGNENEALRNRLNAVKAENRELTKKLADRKIKIEKAGTLAEAAFAINGVIDSAHEAAKQYLDNLEDLYKRQAETVEMKEAKVRASTQGMVDEATRKSAEMLQAAEDKCSAMTFVAQERCDIMKEEAQAYCQMLRKEAQDKCNEERRRAEALCITKVKEFENNFVAKEKEITERCERKERETERACAEMVAKARLDIEARWESLSIRLENFYNTHSGLREMLSETGKQA